MTTAAPTTDPTVAPPVVAVVVVHAPGAWFDETLQSLARQDYPNLEVLFLLAGTHANEEQADATGLAERIRAVLPTSFIRIIEGGPNTGPGFGIAANAVLEVVEGDTGFFCICHDDVALAPDAIRLMVEELYRQNAGIVGPKLVTWDHAFVLTDVGLDVDRFGVPASRVEPGEYDQQQHDSTGEVFAVPSACMLVRADLFRALDGFDETMRYYGEDVDLCWRAGISGARTVVATTARVRHRGELELRRPDLNHDVLRARHRIRSVLTLTSGRSLPLRLVELFVVTLLEIVRSVVTGRFSAAWASTRAFISSFLRWPTYLARRGAIAKLRRGAPPDADIEALMSPGSHQLRSFGRESETRTLIGVDHNVRRWRDRSIVPVVTWAAVIAAVAIASRTLINDSVPNFGEFLSYPNSTLDLWGWFSDAWNPTGFAATAANPTGLAVLAPAGVAWLFNGAAASIMLLIGSILLGGLGVWRLTDLFPSNRERIVALVTYTASPLLPAVISTGRLAALLSYAAVPWFVHLLRTAIGIGTADPDSVDDDLVDGILAPDPRERLRRVAVLAMVAAAATAMVPSLLLVFAAIAVVLGLASLLAGAGWQTAGWFTGTGLLACAVAVVLNLPWSGGWTWNELGATPLAGEYGWTIAEVVTFDIGRGELAVLTLALYVPVVAGLLLARAWRLTWTARAAGLVVVFAAIAALVDRDALPIRVPEIGVLLVPVALGLALTAACAVASFAADVAGGTFGWRQPVGLVTVGALAVGLFPSLLTLTDGAWFAPRLTVSSLVDQQLAGEEVDGDFRVLFLGDPRMLDGAPRNLADVAGSDGAAPFADGVAYTIVDQAGMTIADRWAAPTSDLDTLVADMLTEIAGNRTQRGGRMLAALGIRYVVVPVYDGAFSTPDSPLEPPAGLVGALSAQLDLELRRSPPQYVLYENRSAAPVAAMLSGAEAGAASATLADGTTIAELAQLDLAAANASFGTVLVDRRGAGDVEPGLLHLAVPFDGNWRLTVGGNDVPAMAGLGGMTAFEIANGGTAQLRYDAPSSRSIALIAQLAAWVLVAVVASRARLPNWALRSGLKSSGRGDSIDLDRRSGGPLDDVDASTIEATAVVGDSGDTDITRPLDFGPLGSGFDDDDDDDDDDVAAWVDELLDDDEDGGEGEHR